MREVGATLHRGVRRTSSSASRGYWQQRRPMGENLTRAENYLSLVGLVVLILGGIGVSSVTRVFVQQKVRSIAILKCLGGTSGRDAGHLHDAGAAARRWPAACSASRWRRPSSRPCRRSSATSPALLQVEYGLTPSAVVQGLAIGAARLASVFARAAARSAARQAVAAACGNDVPPPARIRLAEVGRHRRRGRGARRRRRVAGRVAVESA